MDRPLKPKKEREKRSVLKFADLTNRLSRWWFRTIEAVMMEAPLSDLSKCGCKIGVFEKTKINLKTKNYPNSHNCYKTSERVSHFT